MQEQPCKKLTNRREKVDGSGRGGREVEEVGAGGRGGDWKGVGRETRLFPRRSWKNVENIEKKLKKLAKSGFPGPPYLSIDFFQPCRQRHFNYFENYPYNFSEIHRSANYIPATPFCGRPAGHNCHAAFGPASPKI